MKINVFFLFFLTTIISFQACKKENGIADNSQIIGEWITESIKVNDIQKEYNIYLKVDENDDVYHNYIVGKWESNEDQFSIKPNDVQLLDRNYKIISLTETKLTLLISLTEGEYCCDFDEFESEEKLEIIEEYTRLQ